MDLLPRRETDIWVVQAISGVRALIHAARVPTLICHTDLVSASEGGEATFADSREPLR